MMNNYNRGNNRNNMNGRSMPQSRRMPMQNNMQHQQNTQPVQSNNQQQTSPQNAEQPKVSNDRLDNLVNTASKHLNTSPEELKKATQNGNLQKLINNMSPSQAAQLQRILSDENAAKKLLSTPQAQALLRGLQQNE